MSEGVIVAWIGGAAGIIAAVTTLIAKVYEIWKDHKGETLEQQISPIVEKALAPVNAKLDYMQTDVTRMRLLTLIRHEPKDAENILNVGKIYFSQMRGNSEASKQFARWLEKENIKTPEWFTWKRKNGKK
jgi:hypothetical protein